MPFTPFHFGPGAAFKAMLRNHFSFTVFCYTQGVTDCETAYYILSGRYPLHRFFHTWVGAVVMGVVCTVTGRPLCQWALRLWYGWFPKSLTRVFPGTGSVTWTAALSGAFLGSFSHVLLDGIMHRDAMPCQPWSSENALLHLISSPVLHAACLLLGALGIACLANVEE